MKTPLSTCFYRVLLVKMVFLCLLAGCNPPQFISKNQQPEPSAIPTESIVDNTSRETNTPTNELQESTKIEPVVLLIVDDYSIQPSPEPDSDENICITTPNGQRRFAPIGVSTNQGELSHGAVVYSVMTDILLNRDTQLSQHFTLTETQQLATASGQTALGEQWIKDISLWQTPSGHLLVIEIDTLSWDPGSAVERIVAVINKLDRISWHIDQYKISQIRGYVINMSFALVPCRPLPVICQGSIWVFAHYEEIQDAYRMRIKANSDRWNELVDQLQSVNCDAMLNPGILQVDPDDHVFTGFVCELINNSLGTRRLCEFLSDPSRVTNKPVINVAAAGNGGLPFPFAPGLFPNVISVSAEEGIDNTSTEWKVEFSNWGEVKMSGLHPTLLDQDGKKLSGTSFAAPRFSLLAALFLLRSSHAACGRYLSPLNYDRWDNLSLEEAADRFCKDFIQ